MNITELLQISVENNASDLHISANLPPMIRVDGDLKRLDMPALSHDAVLTLIHEIMSDSEKKNFKEKLETDFSFQAKDLTRFRVSVFNQERGAAAVLRIIPSAILSLEQLHAPECFASLVNLHHGLVLVTGATGSGKSTTLAAMTNHINTHHYKHILTIEDPIEFVHQSKKSLINQREVHRDTVDFSQALRSALRQDPDVILLGEMRDVETIRLALTAAETGHLVFATLHTTSAAKTINRIIDVFPAAEKAVVRTMLSESLQAVIAQTLLKKVDGGRIAAHEIMICSCAIKNLIREDKIAQMYSTMQTGSAIGMQTLDQSLHKLLTEGLITPEAATQYALNKTMFH